MEQLELNTEEILLLKRLMEVYIAQLELYNQPIVTEETIESKGRNAIKAINNSIANKLLLKIQELIDI